MKPEEDLDKAYQVFVIILTLLSTTTFQFMTVSHSTYPPYLENLESLISSMGSAVRYLFFYILLSLIMWFFSILRSNKVLLRLYLKTLSWVCLMAAFMNNIYYIIWIMFYPTKYYIDEPIQQIEALSFWIFFILIFLMILKYEEIIKYYQKNKILRYFLLLLCFLFYPISVYIFYNIIP